MSMNEKEKSLNQEYKMLNKAFFKLIDYIDSDVRIIQVARIL
ncbi:hypothetical protein [Borrelia puertoricensis]|nr:hypothetical protein [Borrelia puertoricensis]